MFKLLSHLEKYQIILASKSSRRQDLFKGLNIPFEIYPIELSKFLIIPFPLILIGILFVVFGIYARKYNNAQNYLK